MLSSISSIFSAAGIAYNEETADNEHPIVWLDLECQIGPDQIQLFRLMAFAIEDGLERPYVRLCISPLLKRPEEGFPPAIWPDLAALNFDLAGSKLALDSDGDIALSFDVPAEQFQPAQLTALLDHMILDTSTLYTALIDALYAEDRSIDQVADLPWLAQNFIQSQEGLDLDFTVAALERFEDQVDEEYRQFLQQEGLLERIAQSLGAYIGEILVHQGGATWQTAEEQADSSVRIGGQSYQPFLMARSFLANSRSVRPSIIVRHALKQ